MNDWIRMDSPVLFKRKHRKRPLSHRTKENHDKGVTVKLSDGTTEATWSIIFFVGTVVQITVGRVARRSHFQLKIKHLFQFSGF